MIKLNDNTQYKAVSPAGHLVDLPVSTLVLTDTGERVCKPGFRFATEDDVAVAAKAEEARAKRAAAAPNGPIKPAAA